MCLPGCRESGKPCVFPVHTQLPCSLAQRVQGRRAVVSLARVETMCFRRRHALTSAKTIQMSSAYNRDALEIFVQTLTTTTTAEMPMRDHITRNSSGPRVSSGYGGGQT